MRRPLALLLAALLALAGCAPAAPGESSSAPDVSAFQPQPEPAPDPEPEPEPDPRQAAVDRILSNMTLEEKVGQLFFARCPSMHAAALASEYHLGGYILFGRDFQDKTRAEVAADIAAYQGAADLPLLIGVDEEGGTVVRVSSNPELASHRFQSPQELVLASSGQGDICAEAAREKSGLLLGLGINVNFAPVADVSTDQADFIHDRTLGQDAQSTAGYVASVVGAMEESCIGSVLKHFPGYGNNVDTHTGIAVDQRPYDSFETSDFLPFEAGISAGADAVLVSHNIVTCMDGDLPASLSPEVHRVLREELCFDGVILTDDLAMDAIDQYAETGSAAVLALQAGNDMVLTTDFTQQIPQVLQALADGTLSQEVIDRAAARVLGWKYDLGLLS